MDRRRFLRSAALVAAGVIAADQLEVADRLGWTRKLFAAWGNTNIPPKLWCDGIHDDTAAIQWYIDHAQSLSITGPCRISGPLNAWRNVA